MRSELTQPGVASLIQPEVMANSIYVRAKSMLLFVSTTVRDLTGWIIIVNLTAGNRMHALPQNGNHFTLCGAAKMTLYGLHIRRLAWRLFFFCAFFGDFCGLRNTLVVGFGLFFDISHRLDGVHFFYV